MTATGQGAERFTEQEYRELAKFRRRLRTFLFLSEQEARRAGITPQQYILLLIVRGHEKYPEVAIGEVAEDLKLQHSTASLLVDRAVKKGLLRRVEDASDRRRALVSLTDRGNQVLDRIMSANQEHLHALEEHVPGPPVLPTEDTSRADRADDVHEKQA